MGSLRNTWAPRVQEIPDGDAVFAGWQETGSGGMFALYTIVAVASPFRGSTVSEPTLRKMHLRIPALPPCGEDGPGVLSTGNCGGCPVETRCIGPYRSRTGCSAFPVEERWDVMEKERS